METAAKQPLSKQLLLSGNLLSRSMYVVFSWKDIEEQHIGICSHPHPATTMQQYAEVLSLISMVRWGRMFDWVEQKWGGEKASD